MKRIALVLAAAGVMLGWGCIAQRGGKGGSGIVYRHHFVGTEGIAQGKEATTLKQILALPETAELRDYLLPLAARAPQDLLKKRLPAKNADVAPLVQPMLRDLSQSESLLEISGPNDRIECALAIRLPEERARLWHTNLIQWSKAWQFAAPATVQVAGFSGTQTKSGSLRAAVQWVRAKDWLVLGIGGDKLTLSDNLLQKIQQTSRPAPALASNQLVQLKVDWPRFGTWFPKLAKYPLPPAEVTVYARGENVRMEARLTEVSPLPAKLEPWRIPTNSIKEPLVSFTVGQGIQPFLSRIPGVAGMGLKPLPNQFCAWGVGNIAWETYATFPVANATNAVQEIAPDVPKVVLDLYTNFPGQFAWVSNSAELFVQGLPFVAPALSALRSDGSDFLLLRLIPMLRYTNNAPKELFAQLGNKKNLIYYDWEITQTRIDQNLNVYTLLDLVQRWQLPPARAHIRKWLTAVMPKLGNTITEASITGPGEVTIVRGSHVGFTGGELLLLSRWMENPGFPTRLDTPPPQPRMRLKQSSGAATNRPAAGGSVTNRTTPPSRAKGAPSPAKPQAPAPKQ